MPEFTDKELEFYGRHIMLEDIGVEGQEKLRAANVTLVGAGGIGCPAALYLASGGVGTLRIIDDDIVEPSNLQRQFLYRHSDVGKPKAQALSAALGKLNPFIDIIPVTERADTGNIDAHIQDSSVVVDGTDNFASRHLISKACYTSSADLVSGAAERWDGQVCTFAYSTVRQPCYNCLFPAKMPLPAPTSCALLGVFAPLTGLIGSLMASEVTRILTTTQDLGLQSKLLVFDMRNLQTKTIKIKPDKNCQVCSSKV